MSAQEATREDLTRVVPTWFKQQMQGKLWQNRHKPSWRDESLGRLIWLLLIEVAELIQAIVLFKGAQAIVLEAADVANYCMFVADVVHERAIKAMVGKRVRIAVHNHPQLGEFGVIFRVGLDYGLMGYMVELDSGRRVLLHGGEFYIVDEKRFWPWTS